MLCAVCPNSFTPRRYNQKTCCPECARELNRRSCLARSRRVYVPTGRGRGERVEPEYSAEERAALERLRAVLAGMGIDREYFETR